MSSEPGLSFDLLHDRGVRHEERIVLILARRGLAFGGQYADDAAWQIEDSNGFPYRILLTEQHRRDCLDRARRPARPVRCPAR